MGLSCKDTPDSNLTDGASASEITISTLPSKTTGTGALVAKGAAWAVIQTFATKVVLFVGQIVLAWLLASEDFGKIGMAYTVTAFVALLTNPGIDVILVRRGKRFHLWSTPAFYFGLTTATLGCLVILLVAPLAAYLYKAPELIGVLSVLAFATPIGSLMLVPMAKLRSEMRFKAIAVVVLGQTVLQTVLTVGFAKTGFGVYSFVLPMPIVYLSSSLILWLLARPKIRYCYPFKHWKYLVGDSSYIFGSRVLHTATSQADYILLGALYGAVVVGPYFFAYALAKQAIRLTTGSMQLVLMAGLSRMSAFSDQQTQAALRATRSLAFFGMPLCMLQAATVDPLLRALYGDKWLAAIPLAQLISLGMAFDVPSWAAGSLLESRGQFRFSFYWSSIFATILVIAIAIGAVTAGALGCAIAVCVFFIVCSPLLPTWLFRADGVSWGDITAIYLLPLVVGSLAAGTSFLSVHILAARGLHSWIQFCVALVLGLVVMAIGSQVFMMKWWKDIASQIKHVLPQLPRFKKKNHEYDQT